MQEVTEWRRETLFTNITYLNDLAIDDEFSVVKSPNGTFWRVSVDDTGQLNVKPLGIIKDPINPDAPLIPYATADDISYSSDVSGFNPNPPTIGNALNILGANKQDKSFASTVSGFTPNTIESAINALAGNRIVEAGSNAQGFYWKWENGLALCAKSASITQSGASWHSYVGRWNWSLPITLTGGCLFATCISQNADTNTAGDSNLMTNDKMITRFTSQSQVSLNYSTTIYGNNDVLFYALAGGMWK